VGLVFEKAGLIGVAALLAGGACVHFASNRPDLGFKCGEGNSGGAKAGELGGRGVVAGELAFPVGAAYESFAQSTVPDAGSTYLFIDLYSRPMVCCPPEADGGSPPPSPHLSLWLENSDGGIFQPGTYSVGVDATGFIEGLSPDGGEAQTLMASGGIVQLREVAPCSLVGGFDLDVTSDPDSGLSTYVAGSFNALYCRGL
jgi:hypothetical protein